MQRLQLPRPTISARRLSRLWLAKSEPNSGQRIHRKSTSALAYMGVGRSLGLSGICPIAQIFGLAPLKSPAFEGDPAVSTGQRSFQLEIHLQRHLKKRKVDYPSVSGTMVPLRLFHSTPCPLEGNLTVTPTIG